MFFSRWPSLLLTLALLIVVGIGLKRIDFLLIDEVRAVISIAFGFATSCLLLSLVWILQRKPMHATWPTVANVAVADTPNMHPRASIVSGLGPTVADCVAHDTPPDYENALINSKPISWIVASASASASAAGPNKEELQRGVKADHSEWQLTSIDDLKQDSGNEPLVQSHNRLLIAAPDKISPPSAEATAFSPAETDMTQLALRIVRGFTSVDHEQTAPEAHHHWTEGGRKASYCQLDVERLMIDQGCGSPPRYCEITMPRTDGQAAVRTSSNQSNELGASPQNHT